MLGLEQMPVKIPRLISQQLFRGVLPTYASTHSSRLRQEFEEEMGKGGKRQFAANSKDDSPNLLPTASLTLAATTVTTVRRAPATVAFTMARSNCFQHDNGGGNEDGTIGARENPA